MNSLTLLPSKVKIWKCPSYFSRFFITLEWHLCYARKYEHTKFSRPLRGHNFHT